MSNSSQGSQDVIDTDADYETTCNQTSDIWLTLDVNGCRGTEDRLQQCGISHVPNCICSLNAPTYAKVVCNRGMLPISIYRYFSLILFLINT